MSVPEEAITRGFLSGSACPNFAHDPRLPQLLIYGGIKIGFELYIAIHLYLGIIITDSTFFFFGGVE